MTQPTDRDRERARETCPCWGDGVTGPPTCSDHGGMCELHQRIAEGYAAVRAEGRAEALSPENIADLEANAYEAGAKDMRERAARESAWGAWHTIERRIRSLPLSEPPKEHE